MNPLEALSPTIVAQLQYPQQPTPAARAKYRAKVRREVLGCTSCELHRESVPLPFRGPPTARFVVVGDAPIPAEEPRGPFTDAPGKLLHSLMSDVGINPRSDVLWMNQVSCFPNTGGQARAASPNETLACRGNLLAQVEAGYVPYVLLVGGRALGAFRSDLTVTHNHGELYVWNDLYVVMPIFHPAAVLRGQSGYKALIKEDLKKWHDVVYGGDNPLKFLGELCYKNDRKEAVMWDRDGVPMCIEHWKKWKGQWEKERYRWTEKPATQLTF